jgi:hypothetical protein
MLAAQQDSPAYAALRDKLKGQQLPQDEVLRCLAGLSPDRAAVYLSTCLAEERAIRLRQEKLTTGLSLVGFVLWIALHQTSGNLTPSDWGILLFGPLLIVLSVVLSARRFRPLRHNALTGLKSVLAEVHEKESLEALCGAAQLVDGARHRWEADVELLVRQRIAQILVRLSADEGALLSDKSRQFLLQAIGDNRSQELTTSALLVLGSAQEVAVLPVAETLLRSSLTESVREAATECLAELHRSP